MTLLKSLPSFPIPLWNQSVPWPLFPDFLPSQGCSCSAPVRIHTLGPGHKSWLSTQSFPKSPCPEPALLRGWHLIKSLPSQGALRLEKWELNQLAPPPPAVAEPRGSCKETLLGCISHLGSYCRSDLGRDLAVAGWKC